MRSILVVGSRRFSAHYGKLLGYSQAIYRLALQPADKATEEDWTKPNRTVVKQKIVVSIVSRSDRGHTFVY